MILFYKGNLPQHDLTVWKELADKYNGIFKVAAVDCDGDEEVCSEAFTTFDYPSIQCFPAKISAEPIKFKGKIEFGPLSKLAVD